MNKLKRFSTFGPLNESAEWYQKNGYITSPEITTEDALMSKVESGMTADIGRLLEKAGLDGLEPKIDFSNGRNAGTKYVNLSADVSMDDVGIFNKAIKKCEVTFFSGREVSFSQQEGEFYFKPYVWSTLNLAYESKGGGTNGMPLMFSEFNGYPRNDVWFDIFDGKFYDIHEWEEKTKGGGVPGWGE